VAIFGAGVEGRSFARRVDPICAQLVLLDDLVADGNGSAVGLDALRAGLGGIELAAPSVLANREFDFVIHSPGISRYDERLCAAAERGALVTSPTALFLEDFQSKRVLAVTGSKGKSTTAMLCAAVLGAYGLDAVLGGNIGRPLSELYDDDAHDVFVVELSSFQTSEVTTSPSVGVLTLLAPDHLDWHRSLENYYADKLRLFSRRADVPVAVNGCCEEAVKRTAGLEGRVLYGKDGPVRLEGGKVVASDLGELSLDDFALVGEHNLLNACGALTAGLLLTGAMPDKARLEHDLCQVQAAPSRLKAIGEHNGISYVDDALASNPEGTLAALRVFSGRKIAVILGGHDRGVDYGLLARALEEFSPRPVVLCIGEAGSAIAAALEGISAGVYPTTVGSLEAAVEAASACPGVEVVLFSPAAPTPHEEGSYLDRGRRFALAAGLGAKVVPQ
jgi:UDP-N-acetylmuramoylalanine--D-glutamate ligase